jgi:outer membrane protein assembly factor BamB
VLIVLIISTMMGGGGSPSGSQSTGSTSHSGGTGGGSGNTGASTSGNHTPPAPAIESGIMPWQLAAPISREVVLPDPTAGSLLVAGGLEAGGASASGVFTLAVHEGTLAQVGSLPEATHDAAAAFVGTTAVVVGGGAATPSSTVQGFTPPVAGHSSISASVLGHLTQARADAAAVQVGGVTYVVGGYNGSAMDPEVLATTDGRTFRSVARLPEPIRYAAVAALDGKIYAFGGLASNGKPVSTVQVIDPTAHTATISTAHLQIAVSGAVAAVLGGTVYLAGGSTGSAPSGEIWAFNPSHGTLLIAGHLMKPVAYAGAAVTGGRAYIIGGEVAGGTGTSYVQMLVPNRGFGTAGAAGAGSPYFGMKLLVADRGNNRLLLIDDTGKVGWEYPGPGMPPPAGSFYFPDDAFFAHHGTEIISNQEDNDTIVILGFPSGKVLWDYGHAKVKGSTPGYLNTPDDAYLLKDGNITVADAYNCRVLILSLDKRVVRQIGASGGCNHNPPQDIYSPNGDTPLANGDLLVSEITGSWVDEFTQTGKLVWSVSLPIAYPSDPQQLGPDKFLIADYAQPGGIVEFDRRGHILYHYAPSSGPGELNHPSLVELVPSGVFIINDDYNDRMAAIDPATGALVWQYGAIGVPGTQPGLLKIPDGFDLLAPDGSAPTHPASG